MKSLHMEMEKVENKLPSDWSNRKDILDFLKNPLSLENAQAMKEELEESQRKDVKLRKQNEMKR